MTQLIMSGSIIQSSYRRADRPGGGHWRMLEAMIARPRADGCMDIDHYRLSLCYPDERWRRAGPVSDRARGPASMCQAAPLQGEHGDFQAAVLEEGGIVHYWLDNTGPESGEGCWRRTPGFAAPGATGAGAIAYNPRTKGLDLLTVHASQLVHHVFEYPQWRVNAVVSESADGGAPALLHSSYGNLEALVSEAGILRHYWFAEGKWWAGTVVTARGDGPASLVQGPHGARPHTNLELCVPRRDTVETLWRDDSAKPAMPWHMAMLATAGAGEVKACAMVSTDEQGRELQLLTQEGLSLYHLFRHATPQGLRWMRRSCVRLVDGSGIERPDRARSHHVAQLTGERNARFGPDSNVETCAKTLTRSGVRGTDLGVTVAHGGRRFLLFGDTHWTNPEHDTRDAIGEVTECPVHPGLHPTVAMHGGPLRINGGDGVTDKKFDVPLDGFSFDGDFYVFFSSNALTDGKVMGRGILARARDASMPIHPAPDATPMEFDFIAEFSSWRFINVSVQVRPATSVRGFGDVGDILLIWGSGAYRADDIRLAVIPLNRIEVVRALQGGRTGISQLRPRYFSGDANNPWSDEESDARPLVYPSALGELSVRWVPEIERYVWLCMSGPEDPLGAAVQMRHAVNPWGPWSTRRLVFDWVLDGKGLRHADRRGQFIRDHRSPVIVGDNIFPEQASTDGEAYAPYLHRVERRGNNLSVYYTLSTWNPYQVMLMRHDVFLPSLGLGNLARERRLRPDGGFAAIAQRTRPEP